ncbi:protein PIN-LIKES 7-like isoform X1 [Amaranthus tricolor]|uniref:protein PIN-LIKES 7-like isoform X1 n=1 Tax=Amaranthus tricolor TaxID=29722 RepID=UPI002589FC84|nr:protein PIN-LIKES 7-like isoform X1 [Amaranthus tricolor]XP_057542209.1 protein PIN-LIKES 7-like isoform X1 [Amaranthus tricolor]
MGFWSLFEVASMPILQVLIISGLGAFMATGYINILTADARRSLNKIVYVVFTPALMFSSLAKTVTLQDIISWWFMPINVGLTFLIGGALGWLAVKLLKPGLHLEGLVIATCAAANLGNLVLIVLPTICHEDGSPFGDDHDACSSIGLSYASFSMALGGFYIWTYAFHLVKSSSEKFKALKAAEEDTERNPNKDLEANPKTHLLKEDIQVIFEKPSVPLWRKVRDIVHQIVEELMAPPTVAAVVGLVFGAVAWLKNLVIGDGAPFRVIQNCLILLGDGTIPCITLILGGNLIQGLRTARVKPRVILGILFVKYALLPSIGIGVVKAADSLGFLPPDPLYRFVLMLQFALPPAMSIGTMTQFFEVGTEECSVIFLWTYAFAALALTFWSTIFMWILA